MRILAAWGEIAKLEKRHKSKNSWNEDFALKKFPNAYFEGADGIQNTEKCWSKYIELEGDYVEKTNNKNA